MLKEGESQEIIPEVDIPIYSSQEISAMRADFPVNDNHFKGVQYQVGENRVSLLRHSIDPEDRRFKESKAHIDSIRSKKEPGEAFFGEKVLVNALFQQAKIAKMFDIPKEGLYLSLKPEYLTEGNILMESMGDVCMLTLDNHIEILKKLGASNDQIAVELAGHIFHEAIHDGDGGLVEALLNGKSSLGEVTSITGQLAYYLMEGYKGPKSYDAKCSLLGQKKIEQGGGQSSDHTVATSVAGELLLEQLLTVYPDIVGETEGKTAFEVCEDIIAKIPEDRRSELAPALKRAIADSANKNKFQQVVEKLKQDK